MSNIFIYHANCYDGFCAAFIHHFRFGYGWDYIPYSYGDDIDPGDFDGANLIIADFSFDLETMQELDKVANSIIVLDHHKSAIERLGDWQPTNGVCKLDSRYSGAQLVQQHFGLVCNFLVDYTADRDLWKWELGHSRQVNAALTTHPMDFKVWSTLDFERLVKEGEPILRLQKLQVELTVEKAHPITFAGYEVLCCNNSTKGLTSDIGHELTRNRPFGVVWYFDGELYRYSLRSTDEGSDVSLIAEKFGGAGHRNAAGFSTNLHPLELE